MDGSVCELDCGWFIDEPAQLKAVYNEHPLSPDIASRIVCDSRFWSIDVPFLMDQQAAKIARSCGSDSESTLYRCDDPVIAKYLRNKQRLVEEGCLCAESPTAEEYLQNNSSVRALAREFDEQSAQTMLYQSVGGNSSYEIDLITSKDGSTYILPPNCHYLRGDVTDSFEDPTVIQSLIERGKFDVVVIDPPWPNKFVRRKRRRGGGYCCLTVEDFVRIPLESLMNPNCLVAVWCTNKESYISAVTHRLFPEWIVDLVATWFWVKVTRHGQLVTEHTGQHRKLPYERLILGRYRGGGPCSLPDPPGERILVSVPCGIHSRKPFLDQILRPFLPTTFRGGLEIFARSLTPGWTAWGNQPLYFQRTGGLLKLTSQQDGSSCA